MFILHSSNKTENLIAHLGAVIRYAPLSSPFAKEVLLIQSQGMERWIAQQLASELQVFGNYQFLFPGKFFSGMAAQVDSRLSDAAFERNLMQWRIDSLLRRLEGAAFVPVQQYLSGDNVALKRFQLAQQLAQLFDQYQIMRPDVLAKWQQGLRCYPNEEAEVWQMALWRQITAQTGPQHRGALWLAAIAKMTDAEPGAFSAQLPERVSVFGLNTLPPLFLSFLQGLSRHCQLHVYLLNPAQEFWADLPGKRQARSEEFSGHPLLVALGQQGREFQDMLLDQVQFDVEPASFELNEADSNLQHLQNDLLMNALSQQTLSPDASISIHACHTRMREVEVVKNLLLHALENDPDLQLRDIVVMAPDIEAYEPFIAAVFDDIQHAVADRSLRLGNAALDALIRLLSVSQSRFGWQAVLDLLEQPAVYASFGLSETDLELIRHWLQDTRVRWGKSAQHKRELGLPELSENTWQATLERLLMGYAVGSDADFVDGVLPYSELEGASAQALGGLADFLQNLFAASAALKKPKTLKDWSSQLYAYADLFLAAADEVERREINELLADLAADDLQQHEDGIDLTVLVCWLESMMAERKSSNGFLRGQLTFCSMLPMRSIPFKVIVLLGMNEGEFPKVDRLPTFDLLGKKDYFRKGDRSRRADDRYQFLEILLSVRQQLIITYLGQSIKDNASIPPSVVISELLEVLESSYQLKGLVTKHPLQAFSPRYFDGSHGFYSFSQADCETAKALSGEKTASRLWWQSHQDAPEDSEETVVEVADFLAFFQHPQKYFMQRQLGLRFQGLESLAEEREPFAVTGLDRYLLEQSWLEQTLKQTPLSVKKLQAQGLWLSGALGELEFNRQQALIDAFAEKIRAKNLGETIPDVAIDLRIGNYRLVGKLTHCQQHGSLLYRYSPLKGKDFLGAWLHHLLVNQVQPQATAILASDADYGFDAEWADLEALADWLAIYQQGQQQPNAFFTEAAWLYVQQAYKLETGSRAEKSPLDTAKDYLAYQMQRGYEPELRRLYGNADLSAVLGADFEQHCQTRLLPVWQAVQV
ncbi:exodeoxyribonuclease V subunit gamma [Methylosoma difficile]